MADLQDNTTLECSIYWLLAIQCQGERVFRSWDEQEGRYYPFLNTRMMEEHFFLIACKKTDRWLNGLKSVVADTQPIEEFLALLEPSSRVRNKREHDDEYFGEKPKKEPVHKVKGEHKLTMIVGTSVSCYLDGKLLLGGIFDVREAMDAAGSLQITLRKLQHAYWDKKGKGAADHFKIPERLIGS